MANRVATSLSLSLSLLFLFLFLFFAFSHARDINDPFTKPEPESESVAKIQAEPETTRASNSKPQQHDTVTFTVDSVDPVPLTLVSLRPIGRHFPPRHQLPLPLPSSLRFGHRRCRHGHRREISYGNDMIVRGSGGGGVPAVDRMIPARWVRIRHGEPRISEIPRIDRRFDHHEHRHHHHHHHEEEEKHGEGWFVKKIRKFLNLF